MRVTFSINLQVSSPIHCGESQASKVKSAESNVIMNVALYIPL